MTGKISPSMMCADIGKLAETLKIFETCKIEYLHIDIMDGVFVPNFTLGTDYVKKLRKMTDIPLDVHLMIDKPEEKIHWFDPQPGEYFSVHYESTPHIHKALHLINQTGAKPMLALNPGTHYRVLTHLLDDMDAVLIMTVNPGFAGQKLIEATLKKIQLLRNWLNEADYGHVEIEADGNCSFANAKRMRENGANIFVAGTSSVFCRDFTLDEAVAKFREELLSASLRT